MLRLLLGLLVCLNTFCFSQGLFPHPQAHAHNDYEHKRPLKDALQNGFTSVEADVHLKDGILKVSHHRPNKESRSLEELYLNPLDSLVKSNGGKVYPGFQGSFYLLIDCKTEAIDTYQAIRKEVAMYPSLLCSPGNCPVTIILSGNRPVSLMMSEGYSGLGIDGCPDDLGKGYSKEMVPVISDHFKNWSGWNGKSGVSAHDLDKIKDLANRVHSEGKKLRLWAIPDNVNAWSALLEAGVDIINTDHLRELHEFLTTRGL